MAKSYKVSKRDNEASICMLGAVIASGGQIIVSREQMDQVRNNRLVVHQTGAGEFVFTAVSRSKHDVCDFCDGLGGYAIVGSKGPGQVCPKCRGAGVMLSPQANDGNAG